MPTLTNEMTVEDLRSTHDNYEEWEKDWEFLRAAYDGAKALIKWGALTRHPRESVTNHNRRVSTGYGFGYSRSIVDLFIHYLHKEPVSRDFGKLDDDELWKMFLKDCDLEKTEYEEFLKDLDRDSSIEGVVGVLVDKPAKVPTTRAEEISNRVYPYVSIFRASAILDFEYERDDYGRPYLSYLKLVDNDDRYYIWSTEQWQIWVEPYEDEQGNSIKNVTDEMQAVLEDQGTNSIGEIPFVWLYNEDMLERGLGRSDITDVAIIDASIIRNCSQIEEVVDYGAFPMMRKPKPEKGEKGTEDVVAVDAVLEFDPDKPDSKPDWLDAAVSEPIQAILDVIDRKIQEIYRSSNAGGMSSTEMTRDAESGVALRVRFQLLNSMLVNRGKRLSIVEGEIVRLFRKYQGSDQEEVKIDRSDSYDVAALAEDLENALTAKRLVNSDTFMKNLQKKIVRLMLPAEDAKVLDKIDKEIESYVEPEIPPFPGFGPPQRGSSGGQPSSSSDNNQIKTDDKGKVTPLKTGSQGQ